MVYADFEYFTKPMNTCSPDPNESYTYNYQKHEPSGFCLYIKGLDGMKSTFKPVIYNKRLEDEDTPQGLFLKLQGSHIGFIIIFIEGKNQ